ncbi:hypothetical protein [Xylanibacter oryzae]|uniref:hypothetical protein n=1 Tax=Xylanibacter oryzae TaxID=185293 RepID=UPI0004B6A08E|nr:hypothetical protein [Xylanibacter oryzae]
MNKKKITSYIVLCLVISSGLLFITESWFMSMGIMIILVIVDVLLKEYISKKQDENDGEK